VCGASVVAGDNCFSMILSSFSVFFFFFFFPCVDWLPVGLWFSAESVAASGEGLKTNYTCSEYDIPIKDKDHPVR
jgi:hypothetical protein